MEMEQDGRGVGWSRSVGGTGDAEEVDGELEGVVGVAAEKGEGLVHKMPNTHIREHPISSFFPSVLVLLSRSHDLSVTLELLRLLHTTLHYDSSSKPSLHSSSVSASASPSPVLSSSSSADTPLSHPLSLMLSFRAEFLRLGGPHLVSTALTRSHMNSNCAKHSKSDGERSDGDYSESNASASAYSGTSKRRVDQSNAALSGYKQSLLHLLLSFLFDMPPPNSALQPGMPSSSLKPCLPQRGSLLLLQHLPLSIYGPSSHIPIPNKPSPPFYSLLPILPSLFSSLIPSLVTLASLSVHSCLLVNPLNLSLLEHHSVIQAMCSCLVSLSLHSSTSSAHDIEHVHFEPIGFHSSSKENSNDDRIYAPQNDRYFDSYLSPTQSTSNPSNTFFSPSLTP